MSSPTLIQTLLAIVFATLGIVGFVVSIHPPKTARWRHVYVTSFVALTLVGVVLVYWQSRLAETSQAVSEKAAAQLRRQVASLYGLQMASGGRATQDQPATLADRVYV